MSDVQRVEILEEENNPTIEEQASPPQETQEAPERPAWLPEKFATAEDMATAYGELEAKLSASEPEPTDPPAGLSAEDMQAYTKEWDENKGLSDETYTELQTKYGVARDLVDQYIQGQQAIAEGMADRLYSLTGGQESYTDMIEWARTSLDKGEAKAFDDLMDRGDEGSMQYAIRGLYARYMSETGGRGPSVLQGKTAKGNTNAFQSVAQIKQAMSDPRYKNDPAYRKEVEERMAISNVL